MKLLICATSVSGEADDYWCALVSPNDNLAGTPGENLPAERLRPEPGHPRQVVGANDDVMQ